MICRSQEGRNAEQFQKLVEAWALSEEQQSQVDARCLTILGPSTFKARNLTLFDRTTHFTTKDKERFFTSYGCYVLEGILDDKCFEFFQALCQVITGLVARSGTTETLADTKKKMLMFEERCPDSTHSLSTHTTEHAVEAQSRCGVLPMCYGWEHFQGTLTR